MPRRREFAPLQAQELAAAFSVEEVDYLFIGKSGAILLGYPGTTQEVDIFLPRDAVTRPANEGFCTRFFQLLPSGTSSRANARVAEKKT